MPPSGTHANHSITSGFDFQNYMTINVRYGKNYIAEEKCKKLDEGWDQATVSKQNHV